MSLIIVIIVAVLLYVIVAYNGMIKMRNQVKEAWADIDVQLKRRYNLIPNIVETVKGYATHEKDVLTKVTEARANAINASGIQEQGKAENMLAGALKSLFAVAENYPELKANENFMQLQNELVDTEDKIQSARRFYNSVTRDFNTKIQQFPAKIVAMIFAFKAEEFFEVENEEEKEVVKVDFDKEKTPPAEESAKEPKSEKAKEEPTSPPAPTEPEEKPGEEPKTEAPEQSVDKDMEEGVEKAAEASEKPDDTAEGEKKDEPAAVETQDPASQEEEKEEKPAEEPSEEPKEDEEKEEEKPTEEEPPAEEKKEEGEEEKKDNPDQASMSL